MNTIKSGKAQAGMVVGANVTSPQGMVIVKIGTSLTEKHLRAFKAWGVTEICIESVEADGNVGHTLNPDEAAHQAVAKKFDRLFLKTDRTNEVVAELYRLACDRALRRAEGAP